MAGAFASGLVRLSEKIGQGFATFCTACYAMVVVALVCLLVALLALVAVLCVGAMVTVVWAVVKNGGMLPLDAWGVMAVVFVGAAAMLGWMYALANQPI